MKLFWTGTDSLMLVDYSMRKWYKKPYWWVFRRIIRFLDKYYVEQHYVDHKNLSSHLLDFGIRSEIKIFPDRIKYDKPLPKVETGSFMILYYNPEYARPVREFTRWLYGIDIIEEIKDFFDKYRADYPEVYFLEVDGRKDLSHIYPRTNFMIRPNRHDGASRMRQECEVQGIPYYWTNQRWMPDKFKCINVIVKEYQKWKKEKYYGVNYRQAPEL
jgi:hypothetical protein